MACTGCATGQTGNAFNVSGTKARIGGSVISNAGGIDAVSGVTDLGGNTASGNGNPLQCQNVFCS